MRLYDQGYNRCECYWGQKPADFVKKALSMLKGDKEPRALKAIDLGCGEGKNVLHLAQNGVNVLGFDLSPLAIENARASCVSYPNAHLLVGDMKEIEPLDNSYHLVVSTGSIHCLESEEDVKSVLNKVKRLARKNGLVAFSAFNDRSHDLSGHPGDFNPILLSHEFYLSAFKGFKMIECTDLILDDEHPDNGIHHHHSITRILARKLD